MLKMKCEYCKHYEKNNPDRCKSCRLGMFVKDRNQDSYFEWNAELRKLLMKLDEGFVIRTENQDNIRRTRTLWTKEETLHLIRTNESKGDYTGKYTDVCSEVSQTLNKSINSVSNRLRLIKTNGMYEEYMKEV